MRVRQIGPAGDVHHRPHQRLVERHQRIGVAADAGAVAQRALDRQPERDAGVLDRVVTVHVQIAPGLDREIEQGVPGERVEHVVEEADAGAHRGRRRARRDRRARADRFPWWSGGFRRCATPWPSWEKVVGRCEPRYRARIRPSASATASVSSAVPTEIRRHCASSAAPDTSRTRMPCSSSSRLKHLRAGRVLEPEQDEVGRAGDTR